MNRLVVRFASPVFFNQAGGADSEFTPQRMSDYRASAYPILRGRIMFENQRRGDVEALMKIDAEFRRLYQHHKHLDSKVHDADIGVLPIDDATLSSMKKEKLLAKTRLERMWANRANVIQ